MKKQFKKIGLASLLSLVMLIPATQVSAVSFGNAYSGASSVEVGQIRYNGAAWNYKKSPYKCTTFRYSRDGKTLMTRTATNVRVIGSVYDDLRWGNKYTTKFSWWRCAKK